MSATQKFAWFNLSVIGATLLVVGSLYPAMGTRALGGLGILGLLGFGHLFFRHKAGQILTDERDTLIQRRAWILAYAVFWLVFVLAAVFLSVLVYGDRDAVPVEVIQISVAWGAMLVYAVASIGILVQSGGGVSDAR